MLGTRGRIFLGAASVLLIISGIAGITVGGTSALAGWWLVVVFGAILVGVILHRPRATERAADAETRRGR